MSAQIELDLEPPPARAASGLTRLRWRECARAVLQWTPVWVPLLFLAQLLVFGLLPARAEKLRLDRAEAEVRARAAALGAEGHELSEQALMLADEVYRERVRKSLVDPRQRPLTLERARNGSGP